MEMRQRKNQGASYTPHDTEERSKARPALPPKTVPKFFRPPIFVYFMVILLVAPFWWRTSIATFDDWWTWFGVSMGVSGLAFFYLSMCFAWKVID
eukprot:TRINITY_DN389_c0_g1_i1.p1 TRINITY_DN389_c0_g1~~TRINITY_DN389_c0_g1_i1.p1  ORF type:complete len:103 (-),score=14.01 TRINITY_DN389_c0_g1_i1:78-362(-)